MDVVARTYWELEAMSLHDLPEPSDLGEGDKGLVGDGEDDGNEVGDISGSQAEDSRCIETLYDTIFDQCIQIPASPQHPPTVSGPPNSHAAACPPVVSLELQPASDDTLRRSPSHPTSVPPLGQPP